MDPVKAMEEGKKANREMVELFRSLPDDCYSIELMEKIVSMPMWCVDNNEDNLDVGVALYEAYELENLLDDPAHFEKIIALFRKTLSRYTFGPKMDRMKLAAYEFFKRRSEEDPEKYFDSYMGMAVDTMWLRNEGIDEREEWNRILKEMREKYEEKPDVYQYWYGTALVKNANFDYESERVEDKDHSIEELKESLELAIDYCKTNGVSMGELFDPIHINYLIIERLTELGRKEELIQHYKNVIELIDKANADTVKSDGRPRYSDMFAKAMMDLSKVLEESSPKEAEMYLQKAQKYIQENDLWYLIKPNDYDNWEETYSDN